MENEIPFKRHLKNELVFNIGLAPEQADAVLKWVETLPVHVSASNVHAYIENGVFYVKEWKGNSEHPKG